MFGCRVLAAVNWAQASALHISLETLVLWSRVIHSAIKRILQHHQLLEEDLSVAAGTLFLKKKKSKLVAF